MSEEGQRYISYLLRQWQTESDEGLVWRASLASPQSGERVGLRLTGAVRRKTTDEIFGSKLQLS